MKSNIFGTLVIAIVILLSVAGAKADTMYITAYEVHIRANQDSYVIFRVNRPRGLKLTYSYYTGLPVQSEREGEVNDWPDRWLTNSQLKLAIPGDVARRLTNLKKNNPSLAKAYFNTDS